MDTHDLQPTPARSRQRSGAEADGAPASARDVPAESLQDLLRKRFGHQDFRPYQEAVCRAATEGHDLLLVMPTGAGKSLCYQLPGLARGGTTLVVSPLISLMEDQVAKLHVDGLHAERIHSGRPRADSRQVCADYLAGRLDFLFIAPERLSVPGFPEMLARRPPVLIAVDEAHCISHWGHDFRPDYRMLQQRLPLLRPAPVIALTATATPLVQRDIVQQLGIDEAQKFIHGFRRTNIGIELVELRNGLRHAATRKILTDPANRPAIVYAPARRKAEELAVELRADFAVEAYHAGMTAARRDEVQAAFLDGRLDVIVATIAFGMGIDKPDVRTVIHTALPASVEGYYQEIGRAGRDGELSRAVLFHGYADRRTHEFFLERDYPDPVALRRVFAELPPHEVTKHHLQATTGVDFDELDRLLEKLWIHGGAIVDAEENVRRGHDGWERPYAAQRRHKLAQLDLITRYAQSRNCHMVHLVEHFGDQEDSGDPCGHCDVCAPDRVIALELRAPKDDEIEAMERILRALRQRDDLASGQLFRNEFGESISRNRFERVLGALATVVGVALIALYS